MPWLRPPRKRGKRLVFLMTRMQTNPLTRGCPGKPNPFAQRHARPDSARLNADVPTLVAGRETMCPQAGVYPALLAYDLQ